MKQPVTLANWRQAPHNHWAFHHVRELIPTADIANDPRRIRDFVPAEKSMPPDFERFLAETDTDGLVILHRGRLIVERYGNGMTPEKPHILMSVSKSMLGLLVGLLRIDVERRAAEFIPELKDTAYRDATLRHLLDMRAGVAFDEDYLATSGPIVEYRKATGWNPLARGEEPSDLRSFYSRLKKSDGGHWGRFHYISPNTDLLGLIIEAATGRPYSELMSEHLWKPIGAERSAYITVDRLGAPRTAGGMCVTVRDLARVGQWMIENPSPWIEDIERNGDRAAWDAGSFVPYYPGMAMKYRTKWYILEGQSPLMFGMGIHGQNLFVDRGNQIVIVKVSSQAAPLDAPKIALTMQTVLEIRKHLT